MNEDLAGKVTLTLEDSDRAAARGQPLIGEREFKLEFANTKPQVRFVGKGVILPDAKTLIGALRGGERARGARDGAAGVRDEHPAVPAGEHISAARSELGRVGRVLWRKTIPLASPVQGRWTRYDLDVTELMRQASGRRCSS